MTSRQVLLLSAIAVAMFVSSCGKSTTQTAAPPPKDAPKNGTVFDGLISQEDRARKGVADAMKKNQEKLDQSLKQSDPGTPSEQ